MRKHNGMRPQDIVILLKIICLKDLPWQFKDLAYELFLSPSEISESLHRSFIAGLVDESKRKVFRQSFLEFLAYGFPYVFPQLPGSLVKGIPTAHSHPFFKQSFSSDFNYVWPDANGRVQGLAIEPLYPGIIKASQKDETLYKLLAILDILRVGKTREMKQAFQELKSTLLDESSAKHHTYKSSI